MVIMVLPDRENLDSLAGLNVMKKSTVLLFGIDGVLAQTQKLSDTEHFVNRVYSAMCENNVKVNFEISRAIRACMHDNSLFLNDQVFPIWYNHYNDLIRECNTLF